MAGWLLFWPLSPVTGKVGFLTEAAVIASGWEDRAPVGGNSGSGHETGKVNVSLPGAVGPCLTRGRPPLGGDGQPACPRRLGQDLSSVGRRTEILRTSLSADVGV